MCYDLNFQVNRMSKKSLEEEYELEELYKWLDGIKLSRPKKNVTRDFSDGVLLAELLKSFYPRLVEIHNYSPANSHKAKLNNWITLNKKKLLNKLSSPDNMLVNICLESDSIPVGVTFQLLTIADDGHHGPEYICTKLDEKLVLLMVLKKLNLLLSDEKISAIVSCVPGAIEHFLKKVKRTVENSCECKTLGNNQNSFYFTELNNENTEQTDHENNFESWQKKVNSLSCSLLKLKDQLSEKDEIIDVLQQKLTHLEAMMELKDQRITDLTKQLVRYQSQETASHSSLTD